MEKESRMAIDHRLVGASGAKLPFSCGNRRYRTNINKGVPHGASPTRGSVFPVALINHGYSLWLEHVEEIGSGDEVYWLMWYDSNGTPTIPMSGIFDKAELGEMTKQLTGFLP